MQINQYPGIGSSSLSSLIASTLARRQSSALSSSGAYSSSISSYTPTYSGGSGINYQSSAAIADITAKIDSLNSQVNEIKSKLVVSNSIKNSYSSTITSLNDFLESIKQDESKNLAGITNSNQDVTNIDLINSSSKSQTINLNVKQVATATIVRSDILSGDNVDENTKITDLFAGKLEGYSLSSQRKDLNETKTMKELGIKTGSFTIGNKEISVSESETLGAVMQKIKDAGYDAEITADGALKITGTADKQISFSNQGTNFASALGLTISEGDFSINGKSFSITSETTIKSLMSEINSSRDAGVGAMLQNGKLTLVSNLTGAVLIDIKKGSSNFTNAIGFTSGGEMIADNVVMGADGTATTLKGINSVSTDYSDFTEGTFILSAGRNGNMVSEIINITSGDTVQDVIDKIAASGLDVTASVDKNGNFVLEQKNKGSDYQISVEAGSSNFTEKMGLTNGVENIGITNSGQNTGYYSTITGANKVTLDTEVSAGSFKVNDTTIEISAGTIETALAEINAALADKDVTAVFEDEKIVFKNKIMGNISLSVEGGTSNFGEITGLTEASEGVSSVVIGQVGGKSTLTGSEDVSADTMITDGTVKINGFLIDLSAGTLESVVESLNEHTADTKVTASIVDNRLVLTASENGANSISVEAGISNFVQVTGIAGYQTTAGTEEKFGSSKSAMTMANEVTYDTQILESSVNINGTEITVSGTIANAIAAINAQTATTGVEAFLNTSNHLVLRNVNAGSSTLGFSTSSDFGRVVGAGTYVVTGGSNTKLDQTNATVTGSVTGLSDGKNGTNNTQIIQGSILTIGTTAIELGTSIASAIRAINDKTAVTGVEASLDDSGRFVLKAVNTSISTISFSLSGTGDFGRVTGLGSYTIGASDSGTGVVGARQTTLTGSCDVTGDMKISNSTISILAHNQVQTFELSGTLDDVIKTLSESEWVGHNGITASIENGKFVIRLNDEGAKELTVNVISGDFGRVTGMADYLMGGATITPGTTTVVGGADGGAATPGETNGAVTEITTSGQGTAIVTGGNDVSGSDYVINGTIKIGAYTFQTKNTTLQEVINQINGANIKGVSAYIENDKFVIKSIDAGNVISATGDFARITGIASYSVGASVMTGSAGDIGTDIAGIEAVGMESVEPISKADALSKGYIVIESAADLINAIAVDGAQTAGKTFILMNNIDMSTINNYVSKSNFAGIFDGNGYTISNLSAENGIFASTTETSTIKNVSISGFNIVSVVDNVGALAGINNGLIENSSIDSNSLVSGNSYVGGLVGGGNGKLENLTSYAEVRANGGYAGGIAGSSGDIVNSNAFGKIVAAGNNVGGIAGYVTGNIDNSFAEVSVSGADNTGGLAGSVSGKISLSYSKGDVTGNSYVGGLVGTISSSIKDSYSWSNVNAANYAGGLVGQTTGNVINSYTKGNITASGIDIGGLIGAINADITIDKTYAEGTVQGASNVGGLIGATIDKKIFTLTNSYAKGNVTSTQGGTSGGLIGFSNGGSIMNTYAAGNVTVSGVSDSNDRIASAGGLIGQGIDTNITRSFASGVIRNVGASRNNDEIISFAGGLIGVGNGLKIDTSYSTGSVTLSLADNNFSSRAQNISAGGLIGKLGGVSTVNKSWASGAVTLAGEEKERLLMSRLYNYAGGLIGSVDLSAGAVTVSNTYATGMSKITSADAFSSSYMGGLIGGSISGDSSTNYLTISNSYSAGKAVDDTEKTESYDSKIGGLFGYSETADTVLIENSFFDTEKSGISNGTGSALGCFVGAVTTSQINEKVNALKNSINESTQANSYSPSTTSPVRDYDKFDIAVNRISKEEAEAKGYIVIESAQDFIDKIVNNYNSTKGKTYILTADLDFTGLTGYSKSNFWGTFDGNGYSIKGLTDSLFRTTYGGSTVDHAEIKNVALIDVDINRSSGNTGALIGQAGNYTSVSNVYVTGSVKGGNNTGAIVGTTGSYVTMTNSHSTADVSAYNNGSYNYIGGLVGYLNSYGNVSYSYATGTVSGNNQVGGLFGAVLAGTNINNVFTTGTVTGKSYAGGLIGDMLNGSVTVSDSYSLASVNISQTNGVGGGLIGRSTGNSNRILNSYALGKVSSVQYSGGIIGQTNGAVVDAAGSWWDSGITGQTVGTSSGSTITNYLTNANTHKYVNDFIFTSQSDTSYVHTDILKNKIFTQEEAASAGFVVINTAEDFKNFLSMSGADTSGKTFILMNDINLSGVTLSSMSDFAGTFYGNGHTISNFTSTKAMFDSVTSTGSIRNLKINNAEVVGSGDSAILVTNLNGGVIDNVHVTGDVATSSTGKYVGGLVAKGNGHIDNSGFNGVVTGKDSATGGLIGHVDNYGITITNSYTTGSVLAATGSAVGGLIGDSEYIVKVENSLSSSSVAGDKAGGIIGDGRSAITIINNTYYKKQSATLANGSSDEMRYLKDTSVYNGITTSESGTSSTFVAFGWDSTIWSYTGNGPRIIDTNGMNQFNITTAGTAQVSDTIGVETIDRMSKADAIAAGYIVIESASDFIDLIAQDGVDTLGKTYILMSDIDMSAVSNYVSKSNFAGTFDGNGYSIKNMSAQNGLFATATDTSVIKNVKIVNANIGSSIDNVGALAGSSTGVIENSSIDADSLVGGNSYVGGLVGGGSATIKNSSSDAEVRANISYGGGLAGSAGDISNSVAAGSAFSFGNYVGGLAAQVTGNITNSNVIADVSGMSYAGGLAAVITGDIVNSNVSGAVTGTDYTGGLAGKITGDIEDSFSKIVLTGASYTGGLAGEIAGDISDSYSQGTLNATGINVGGLVGRLNSSNQMTIESSYSEMTVTGYNAVGGLIGGTVTGSTTDTLTSFTVINSYATGNVEARGGGTAGGLIGYAYGGTVLNSYAKGSVLVSGQNSNGFNYQYAAGSTNSNGGYVNSAGGLIGLGMNGAVRNSFATGNVVNKGYSISGTKTTSKTGGLMGSGNYNIFNSYASGNVTYSSTMASVYNTNENNSVGGLVGKYYGGTIEQAWSTGSVIASNYQKSATISTNNRIGGLVGEVSTGSGVNTVIKDTYSQSSVTMQQYSYQGETDLGGLVGFSSGSGSTLTIQNSYASAAIKDTAENYTRYATKAGGLIGYSDTANSIKIENTFFNYQTAGIDNAFGSSNNGSVYALDSELIGNKISSLKDTISAGAEVEKKPATSESEFITEVNRISEEEAIARGYVVIKTAEDFMNAIAENGNGTAGKVYILMNDIDMSSVTGYKGRNNFAGIFDGNGYKIKNLSITTSQSGYVGVFEQIRNGAVVKNVGVENININVSSQRVGALVGYMQNGSAVINSYSTGTVAAGQTRGGLVGHADGKTTIKDSHSSVNVLGYNNGTYNYAGGLVGYVNGNSSNRAVIENSYANGTVAGYAYIGGLVGYANYTDISNSYSSGVVTYVSESNKNGEYRAGLVGHLNSQNVVTDSYSTATVNGANYAGGLFGLMGSTNKVFDSYYSGTLNSIGSYVGGIAGQMNSNNTIYNVKISGTINTTGNYASNIVGNLSGNNSVFNSEFKATLGGNNKFGLVGYRYSGTLTVNGVWFDANAAGTTNAGNSISGSYSSESDYSVIYDAKIAENQRITEEEATQSGYVLIKTSEDLKNFLATDSADTEGKTYVLMRDIDLNGVSGLVAMSDFKGTLYGNGYTIKNFSSQNGFFNSIASGGSVRNLNFYNSNVAATTHAGTVANYLNGGVIDHVTVTNGAVSVADVSGQSLGGLVGYGTGTISYSGFNGTVSGKNASYGGLVGYVSDKGAMSILNSYASGSVSGTDGSNVGGLVGLSNASAGWLNIQDSYADMTVNGTTKGGLVGNATEANTRILDSAYRNSGNISILGNVDDIAYFMDGSITNTISSSQLLNGSLFTNNGWSSEVWEFNGNPPTLASSSLLDDFSLVEVNTDAATIKGSVTVENGGKDNLAFKGQKDGVMTIDISGVGKINIEIAEGDSLQDVLDKISYANGKLSARIDDDGKIVISYNGTTSSMLIEDTSGFAAFYGLKARSTTWNPTVTVENYSNQKITGGNSVLGTDRIVNGSVTIAGQTFTAGSKTLSDVVNEINSAGIKGVAASITDGKFTITSEYGAIDFSASGDFARVTGLASYTVGSVTTEKVTDGTTQSSFGVAGTTEVQKISKADALEAGYIVIESVQDFLNAISSNGANTAGKTFILMADIDLSSQSTYTNKSNFAGTLDGNGYSIKNLTSQNGIFTSTTNTAVIKNLTLENINVSSTADNVGALVGNNAGTISNVEVDSATRVNGKNQVGGIVGYTTGKIEKSESHAEVTGTGSYTGGLAGRTLSDISDSIATGSVTNLTTNNYVGGLVGHVQNGSIVNSNASGTVNSKGSYVGGLAGYTSGSVTGAFASGEIHGLHYVGGLIGQTTNSVVSSVGTGDVFASNYAGGLIGDTTGTITASFATGDVEAANYVGGLVGQTTKDIKESYAKGNVTASASYAGGLIGYLKSGGATFDNNFAIGNVTGGIGVGGLIGATTETLISYTLKNSYASGDVNSTGGGTAGGLIGFTNGGTIENVKATGDVTVSGQNGDTSNCYNFNFGTGNVSNAIKMASAGGLIGLGLNGTVTSSYAKGNVTNNSVNKQTMKVTNYDSSGTNVGATYFRGNTYAGGLMGAGTMNLTDVTAGGNVVINQLENSNAFQVQIYAGGLVGSQVSGTIDKAAATGKVSVNDSNRNSAIGYYTKRIQTGSASICITCGGDYNNCPHRDGYYTEYYYENDPNSYKTTSSSSEIYTGGLVGYGAKNNTLNISNTYSTSDIDVSRNGVKGWTYGGGLVGSNNKTLYIGYSYATGTITDSAPESRLGALFGYSKVNNSVTISSSFYDAEKSGHLAATGTTLGSGIGVAGSLFVEDKIQKLQSLMSVEKITEAEAKAKNYTIIKTADEFKNFLASSATDQGKTYILMADINLQGLSGYTGTKNFAGTLDGNGYTISNYTATTGFFNQLSGTVKNLKLDNVNVTANESNSGIIAKTTTTAATIVNTHVSGILTNASTAANTATGGLVGSASGLIERSSFTGTVSNGANSAKVGGLAGVLNNQLTINSSYVSGSIYGSSNSTRTGGLLGDANGKNLLGSENVFSGTISGTGNLGGLVGNVAAGNFKLTNTVYNAQSSIKSTGNNTDLAYLVSGATTQALTTEQMSNVQTYLDAGWDTGVWNFADYPSLKMEQELEDRKDWMPNSSILISDVSVTDKGLYAYAFKGQQNGEFTLHVDTIGDFTVQINAGDTLLDVLDKFNKLNARLDARINEDGKITIAYQGAGVDISVTDTSGFAEFYGLTDSSKTWDKNLIVENSNIQIDSSGDETFQTVIISGGYELSADDVSIGGTIQIGDSPVIDTTGKTIQQVIDAVNASAPEGITVGIDEKTHKFTVTSHSGMPNITVTGDFARVTGLASYTTGAATTSTVHETYTKLQGSTSSLNGSEMILGGSITVGSGAAINTAGKTLNEIASEINSQGLDGVNALIQDGKFTIQSTKGDVSITAAGDFARVTGMGNYSVDAAVNTSENTEINQQTGGFVQQVDRLTEEEAIDAGYMIIKTAEQLVNINQNLDGKYILMSNIDLSDYGTWASLGTFTGEFNGNGYVIKGLSASGGLFTSIKDATIQNVGLVDVSITRGTSSKTGAIASDANGTVNIINCYSTGTIVGHQTTGGLIGYATGTLEISKSYSTAQITTDFESTGGLLGKFQGSLATISDSFYSGNITAGDYTGGLLGTAQGKINITSSYVNNATINAGGYVGGLIGNSARYIINVDSSYFDGDIIATVHSGGLFGYTDETFLTISKSYSNGSITTTASDGRNIGGLIGAFATVAGSLDLKNSYSTMDVSGVRNIGGLIGYNAVNTFSISNSYAGGLVTATSRYNGAIVGYSDVKSKFTNVFWDTEKTNTYNAIGNQKTNISGTSGLATSAFADQSNFSGWDSSIWDFSGDAPTLIGVRQTSSVEKSSTITGSVDVSNLSDNAFYGQKTGSITFSDGTSVSVSATDTRSLVIEKLNNAGLSAEIDENGKISVSKTGVSNLSVTSDTSGFSEFYGLNATGKTWSGSVSSETADLDVGSTLTGSVNANISDPAYIGQQSGSFSIKVNGGNTYKVNISANDSLKNVLDKINALDSDFNASVNSDGKIEITYNGTDRGIYITDDTSGFSYVYGLASESKEYAVDKTIIQTDAVGGGGSTEGTERAYKIIGANDVSLSDYIVHGSIQIESGAVIDISGNTLGEIIDKINAQGQHNIQALIEDGKFVIKYKDSDIAPSFTATGDFARVTGLSNYIVSEGTYSNIENTSSTVTGSVSFTSGLETHAFKGQKDGSMTIAVTGVGLIKVENITASDSVGVVLDKIKAANSNLSAYINNEGKITITYNGSDQGIAIGDDSTGFSAFYGLRSTQTVYKGEAVHDAPTPIITHTSSSTLLSAANNLTNDTIFAGQTSSSFDIYLGEDFVKSVVVSSNDTVEDVINKINGDGLEAKLVDGRIQISTVQGTTLALSVVSFNGNWSTLAGLHSGDTVIQAAPNKVLGAMNDLTYIGGTVKGMTGSHVFAGLQNGTFKLYMNNTTGTVPTIRVNATDTVDDVLKKMKDAVAAVGGTLNATVKNGQIVITASADFATSISFGDDTSGFLQFAGLTNTEKTYDANYTSTDAVLGTDMFLGSVSGITENHVFGDLTAGTMTITSGTDTVTVDITETSSVKDIIKQIQSSGAFIAGLVDGKFFIQKTATNDSEITVTSTSNFAQLAGLESGVFTGNTTTSSGDGSQSQITGSVAGLDGSKTFSYTKEGYFTISVGGENAVNIEVTAETTIQDVIDAINDTNSYTAKLDDEGRLVVATSSSADASIKISNGTTNFAKIVGLNAGYISSNAESTKGDLDIASSLTGSVNNLLASNKFAAGDFQIIVEAPDGTIKQESFDLTGKETLYTILNRISDSSLGLTAEYKNGGVVLTANETGAFKISVVDGTSDFAEKTGFTTNGTQSVTTVLGSQPDVTSTNTTYSVSVNGFCAGNFYISLTDLDGNIVKTTQINVLATDTVDSLISKINNSGAGVNAYINNKDQLVLAMNSDMDANSIVIQKGTSDFTNKIGFTQGGDVSDDAIYLAGDPVGNTTVSSNVLAYTTSTTLSSLGITEGNFVLNGKTIQVTQDIQTLIDNINAAFTPNDENGVRASFENGRIVLTAAVASSESVINIEAGSSNFTEFAGLTTNKVMNTSAQTAGKNAQFEVNGTSFEQESNTVYIDKDGNVTQNIEDAALRLTLKATGITLITIDKSQLSAPIDKLQTFVNKFNQTMSYANNSQLAGDAGLTAILNKIKSALTADIDGQSGTIDRLMDIGINVYEDSNGTKIYLEEDKFNEQYLNNPEKVTELLVGDDSKPLNYYKAGSFTRLSDTMSNTKNYFSSMTSSLTNQKKSIEKEITLKKSELRELERQLASSGSGSGGVSSDLAAYIAALDEKLNLLTELIMQMQGSGKGGSGSGNSVAYILNRNNPSFGIFF